MDLLKARGSGGSLQLKPESPGAMGTACPARPLREKFRSGWHYGLQLLWGRGGFEAAGPQIW